MVICWGVEWMAGEEQIPPPLAARTSAPFFKGGCAAWMQPRGGGFGIGVWRWGCSGLKRLLRCDLPDRQASEAGSRSLAFARDDRIEGAARGGLTLCAPCPTVGAGAEHTFSKRRPHPTVLRFFCACFPPLRRRARVSMVGCPQSCKTRKGKAAGRLRAVFKHPAALS